MNNRIISVLIVNSTKYQSVVCVLSNQRQMYVAFGEERKSICLHVFTLAI